MVIGGFQKVSFIDYPGKLASVVFTAGCNFRCPFCHNPSLVNGNLDTLINEDEIFLYLSKRVGKLDAVTVSGGEPTLQPDLLGFMSTLKQMGFLVKLDSNGTSPDVIRKAIDKKIVDYIAMDMKAPLKKYCDVAKVRVDIDKIKESIDLIMNSGLDYEFRTTIVKRLMDKQDVLDIGKDIKGAKKYYLQHFESHETVDPSFINASSFSEEDFEYVKTNILQYVDKCFVR